MWLLVLNFMWSTTQQISKDLFPLLFVIRLRIFVHIIHLLRSLYWIMCFFFVKISLFVTIFHMTRVFYRKKLSTEFVTIKTMNYCTSKKDTTTDFNNLTIKSFSTCDQNPHTSWIYAAQHPFHIPHPPPPYLPIEIRVGRKNYRAASENGACVQSSLITQTIVTL